MQCQLKRAIYFVAAHARIDWLVAIFSALKQLHRPIDCHPGLEEPAPDLIRGDPCWMTHCHSPHARFSLASDLWIADRVRNDPLLYWMLSRSFLKFKNGFSASQGSKLDWCAILAGFICSGL